MGERKQYHVPRYERDGAWGCVVEPDYYPLTDEEIAALLMAAQGTTDAFERSSIEMRLCQGIWGHTSAYALNSPVWYAAYRLRSFYREQCLHGATPALVQGVRRWMEYPFRVEQVEGVPSCASRSADAELAGVPLDFLSACLDDRLVGAPGCVKRAVADLLAGGFEDVTEQVKVSSGWEKWYVFRAPDGEMHYCESRRGILSLLEAN